LNEFVMEMTNLTHRLPFKETTNAIFNSQGPQFFVECRAHFQPITLNFLRNLGVNVNR
jgi:hypothetical protein